MRTRGKFVLDELDVNEVSCGLTAPAARARGGNSLAEREVNGIDARWPAGVAQFFPRLPACRRLPLSEPE
jgi:hypothetical protein